MFMTEEQSKMLGEVSAHLGVERSDFMRSAVLCALSAAVERWGEEAAAKIVADRLHAKWLAECSDPEGAVQWARKGAD